LLSRARRHALPAAALASAACADGRTSHTFRRTTPLVGGDAEWYREQDEHRRLNLPLVEEARLGWWHEVTRRVRENGESADARATDGTSLLHVAAQAGRRKLVEELLVRGATASVRDSRGRTCFLCAAESGHLPVVETLAVHDPSFDCNDQDATGASAVAVACRLGHVRLVRWLCNRRELRPNDVDRYGVSALHKATSFGQIACVEALLNDRRVNVDLRCGVPTVPASYVAKSGGESALHLACSHTYTFHHEQHSRIARLLLSAGADPNLSTARGRTAVHCAAAAGNVAILRDLLQSGRVRAGTSNMPDADGRTPSDLARGDAGVLALLRSAEQTPTPQESNKVAESMAES